MRDDGSHFRHRLFGLFGHAMAAGIASEKLRYDLYIYDRRFAIYIAFHALLVAFTEKSDVETELRAANAAKAHAPFLLDVKLAEYLEELHKEAFRINAESKQLWIGDTRPSVADFAPRSSKNAHDRRRSPKRAFPNNQHSPAGCGKSAYSPVVPIMISADLCLPEFRPRRRYLAHRARVAVPEATMNGDDRAPRGKHQIGAPWQIFAMARNR